MKERGISYETDSALHDFLYSMTSPFISEDLVFSVVGSYETLDIWYKGFYYNIIDSSESVYVNNFKYDYLGREEGIGMGLMLYYESIKHYHFIGKTVEDICKVLITEDEFVNLSIYLDIYEGYAKFYDVKKGIEFKVKGVEMSKEAFLGKVRTE